MIAVRRSEDRGHADHGWLDSYHTFSFADYYDPAHVHFRSLRVLNEDYIAGGQGFPSHPHRDMEIVTLVISGALEHRDSMGNRSVLEANRLQRMTAGTGVIHSEYNASPKKPVHLLQIWILPDKKGLEPGYEEKNLARTPNSPPLVPVARPEGNGDVLTIHQDASIFQGALAPGATAIYPLAPGRHAWVQVYKGRVQVNGEELKAGDAAGISAETRLSFEGVEDSEFLLFDLA